MMFLFLFLFVRAVVFFLNVSLLDDKTDNLLLMLRYLLNDSG